MADEDFDALAAEYALGTLEADERTEAEQLAARDAGFAGRIAGWERRLGTLEAMVDPIEPPAEVWTRIRERIGEASPESALRLPEVVLLAPARDAATSSVTALRRRVRRWRWLAALTTAIAAALLLFGAIERYRPDLLPPELRRPVETKVVEKIVERRVEVPAPAPPAPGRFVAVLQADAGAPAFLLTVNVGNRTLTVRRVAPAPEAGTSHQLWLISDRLAAPHSLGLIGAGEFTQRALSAYDPETIKSASYAVSLEPEGGSPTGAPSGPALFTAKLIEAVPPSSPP